MAQVKAPALATQQVVDQRQQQRGPGATVAGSVPAVKASADASEANVLVTIARGDQVSAPVNARDMAKRLGWKYQSVFANRHLVVGIDRSMTQSAMDFLSGER